MGEGGQSRRERENVGESQMGARRRPVPLPPGWGVPWKEGPPHTHTSFYRRDRQTDVPCLSGGGGGRGASQSPCRQEPPPNTLGGGG